MEYTIDSFVARIREVMYDNFPYFPDEKLYRSSWGVMQDNKAKHKGRTDHIRDVAFMNLPITTNLETRTFDIGSEYAELVYPYYHILQDSEVIHKRNQATKRSKGSQDKISDKSARDYGRVNWNGKTYTQEYKKNVRGGRSKKTKRLIYIRGEYYEYGKDDTYVNIHYHYIDRILDSTLPWIAHEFGMKISRKVDTGLEEENALQQEMGIAGLIDILDSFSEEYYD
jgi:hypothetical protein